MSPEITANVILLRALWAVAIVAVGLSLYWLSTRLILARAKNKVLGLEGTRPNSPILLYFTTPTCGPCKTIQRPAIQQVKDRLGEEPQVVEIDAAFRPEVANHWGVMSVPTTFIIDAKGRPRHVNHGVTTADKLLKQYNNIHS